LFPRSRDTTLEQPLLAERGDHDGQRPLFGKEDVDKFSKSGINAKFLNAISDKFRVGLTLQRKPSLVLFFFFDGSDDNILRMEDD
jgi:hypothetical protein